MKLNLWHKMSKLVTESTWLHTTPRWYKPKQKRKELRIWTPRKVSTWRQRTYLFVYPKSFTNGTSIALASWRAHVTNLVWYVDVLEQ
jgi:hypothetical protein